MKEKVYALYVNPYPRYQDETEFVAVYTKENNAIADGLSILKGDRFFMELYDDCRDDALANEEPMMSLEDFAMQSDPAFLEVIETELRTAPVEA